MHIHHINCACMKPLGGAFYDGFSKGLTAKLACHCLAIETNDGIVMVDTGVGMQDVAQPERISGFFRKLNRIQLHPRNTALYQLEQLGFKPSDVRHVVMTHLDFDHAGGIADFPEATVHVMLAEIDAARTMEGFIANRRYRPDQWGHVKKWEFYPMDGEAWRGLSAVRNLRGLPPEIMYVPLAGHTPGHAGVAVQTPEGYVLDAGDAYFYRGEMEAEYKCTPGLRFYQWMMETDRAMRLANQQRLRDYARKYTDTTIFAAHDVIEFEALAKASMPVPGSIADLRRITADEGAWQKEIPVRHQIREGVYITDPGAAPMGTDQEAGGAITTPNGDRKYDGFLNETRH